MGGIHLKFKRLICLLLSLVTILCIATTAFADQNWTGDDGETDDVGNQGSYWGYYLQGIRISVFDINTKRVLGTADYSNLSNNDIQKYPIGENETTNIAKNWFGYNSKLYYMKGGSLRPQAGTYSVRNFNGGSTQFPNCINQDETSNFAAVKEFFGDEAVITGIASDFGMDYDTITNGEYKLILEPVVYFRYGGDWYAMTAAEAGAWKITYGSMAANNGIVGMTKLTELTLPLCMFLEYDDNDVGITAYSGGAVKQSGQIIRDQMGVGILSAEDMTGAGDETEPCCDCDPFCPCKYDDDGDKRPGPCRCYDDPTHDHPNKIPCTPTYPPNCLCQTGNLTIKKVDAQNNQPLSGAVFSIMNKLTGETKNATTGSDGYARFNNIHIGYWVVTESSAPSGYIATTDSVTVQVSAGRTVSKTFTNEKDQARIDPPVGDNIIWGYQLTKSFTNPTNFSTTVDFPANARPSTSGCSGYTAWVHSVPYWGTAVASQRCEHWASYISGYDDEGHPIYKSYLAYVDRVYRYRHNNGQYTASHRTGYQLLNRVVVHKNTFLNSTAFTENGMGRFKIMHNGGYYKYQFNINHDYEVTRTYNVYRELTTKTWISHRNGGLRTQNQEIRLASYMAPQNASYKSFYSTYSGYTATEASSYASNPSNYNTINNITTKTTHGNLSYMTRYYNGKYCNGGVKYNETFTAYTNRATQSYKYSVEGTYKASARTRSTATTSSSRTISNNNTITQVYQVPSNSYTFYPTYRMWYTSTLGANDTSTAWMLSAGRRTFQATDALKITTGGGQTDVWAPWSRDWTDKYTDNSTYGSEQSRGYSVIKAGMVVRAVSTDVATITITAAFNVQDPAFAPSDQVNAVKRANDAKAREMQAAVDRVVAEFTNNAENTYGYYSNLWEATSENIVALSGGALDVPCPSWATTESPKTRLNIADSFTPTVRTTYTAYRGSPDGYVGTVGSLTINGQNYVKSNSVSHMNAYTGTTGTVAQLLDSSFGTSGKNYLYSVANSGSPDKTRWYEEYYDGIRVCEIVATITVPASAISTEYHQVHSQLSDSTTDMNALATNLRAIGYNKNLFSDGMFGIGLCAVSENNIVFGGNNFGRAYLFWPAKEFGVRGSVYDLAQNATQQVIKLR